METRLTHLMTTLGMMMLLLMSSSYASAKDKTVRRGMTKVEVEAVLGFSSWVTKEVERITKLFETTSVAPTPEEKRAGVDQLSFGLFGLVDYYATRMGITDHEQVESVPWIRVYKCLDMDAEKIRYERRLRKIYQDNNK